MAKGDRREDAYAFLRTAVKEVIRSGRFLPEYDDPDQVAKMLWGALHGLISGRIAKAHDPWVDFAEVRKTAALARRALFRGLLKSRVSSSFQHRGGRGGRGGSVAGGGGWPGTRAASPGEAGAPPGS